MQRDEKDRKSLLEIAESVSRLVIDSAKMKRFREQDRAFYKVYKEREKQYEVYCEIILQHRKAAETNPQLHDYADGKPPYEGWIWEDNFLPYKWKGFWRPAVKEPSPDLLDLLSLYDISSLTKFIVPGTPPPKFTDAEKLMMDYVLLTIIHDKALKSPTTPKINDGIWPEGKEGEWDNSAWREVSEHFENPNIQAHINLVFDRVNADLDSGQKKPTEAELAQTQTDTKNENTYTSPPGGIFGDIWNICGIPINVKKIRTNLKSHPVLLIPCFFVIVLVATFPIWWSFTSKMFYDSRGNEDIGSETKTSGESSPAIVTSGPNSPVIVNYNSPQSEKQSNSPQKQIFEDKNKIKKDGKENTNIVNDANAPKG